MEILNEKAERLQAKKDMDFMKEIEERVKKELKFSISGSGQRQSINQTRAFAQSQGMPSIQSSTHTPTQLPQLNRTESQDVGSMGMRNFPSVINEEQLLSTTNLCNESLVRSEVEHVVGKWGDKIKGFEVQLR
jgi:RNA binding exosome subunit